LDIVEGSTPTETEKETVYRAEAGNVEAPAAPGVMSHRGKEKKRRKPLDDGEKLD
jgi:hypothetical protein